MIGPKSPNSFALDGKEWMSTELQWYSSAPHYMEDYKSCAWTGDYKIYVWQPQIDVNIFPPHKAIVVLSAKSAESMQTRDVIILRRSNAEEAEFLPTKLRDECRAKISLSPPTEMDMEILTLMLCLCNVIISDTRKFEMDLLDQVAILVISQILPASCH